MWHRESEKRLGLGRGGESEKKEGPPFGEGDRDIVEGEQCEKRRPSAKCVQRTERE